MAERAGHWTLIVHGGAKTIAADDAAAHRAGCLAAAEAGATVLRYGGGAVQAVQAAVRRLEDDPTFNAGIGSVAGADGGIEMDAAIMDGTTLDVGAVAGLRDVRNPIAVAAALLREPTVMLAGPGADRFAAEHGLEPRPAFAESRKPDHDTVGCVAFDVHGHLAAATSTGGLAGTPPGRVGDSPLPGCGLYADDAAGAVALSGEGEAIIRTMLAARVVAALETSSSGHAARHAIDSLARVGGEAGAIVIDRAGRPGIAHNSDHFAIALARDDLPLHAGIHRDELKDLLDD